MRYKLLSKDSEDMKDEDGKKGYPSVIPQTLQEEQQYVNIKE